MTTRTVADHTLYHLSPKGFWKKFRDATVVNPEISSGLPLPTENRQPPPASRPEKYSTPATKASDPAQNPYWKRDVRRAYPQLSVVTQSGLSSLLIQHNSSQAVAAPSEDASASASASVPVESVPKDLTEAIATLATAGKVFSEARLPPSLPTPFKRWVPESAPDAPHDPRAYFPMRLIK
ncbi:21 kDa subunit of NADH dehydrogenase [Amylostereum chailletii]|nr:21 kDa subunit of NADH dehydrogenase [Amylostereum chailletii]